MVEKLDELDVRKIHRRNREVITGYLDFIEELAKKHKLGKYKEGASPEREKLLEKARQEYRAKK